MARPANVRPKTSQFVVLASMCIVVAALYFAQEVLIPLALAILFCFLLGPLVARLERWRVPRAPAVMVAVFACFAVVVALGWVVTAQVLNLAERLPDYETEIVQKVGRFKNRFAGDGDGLTQKLEHAAKQIEQATTRPATQSTQEAAASQPSGPPDPVKQIVHDAVGAAAREIANAPPRVAPPAGTTRTNPLWVFALPAPVSPIRTLGSYLGVVLSPLGTLGLVIVFVIFILLQREDLRDRMIRLVGHGDLNITTQALDDAGTRISRYLLAQAVVNGTYGFAVAIGLLLIGHFVAGRPFPSFVLWALLCAVLRFIPYIGPWIGAAFPIALSLTFPGFSVFLWTAGMFVAIELLSNNLMEPWLYGTSTGMSTIAVLVSAVFWTWLWGAVGLLLATPLTVCLVVIGKYVPQMRFLDILLGDEPVLEPPERVYQRLLAMDQEEATELLRNYLKEGTLLEVYDDVLLPALALAEQDRHKGRLDEQRQEFIRRAMRDIIEELGDEWRVRQDRTSADAMRAAAAATVEVAKGGDEGGLAPHAPADRAEHSAGTSRMNGGDESRAGRAGNGKAAAAEPPDRSPGPIETTAPDPVHVPEGCTVNIVCLPAHDEADDIVGLMFTQLLEFRGYCAFHVSVTKLAGEMVQAVERREAHAVVVSALPPAAVAHSRYLCKRLHARFPDINMVVGLWTVKADLKKARERVTCDDKCQVASTMAHALDLVHQMVQPVIVAAEQERLRAEAEAENA